MNIKKGIYLLISLTFVFLIYNYWNIFDISFQALKNWLKSSDPLSLIISLAALLVSIIALIYTIRAFWLKTGEKFRFTYTTSSSIYTDDRFVSSITLENLKDKSVVVFAIYFKIGNNSYIILEEFKEKPLIIKPFEVYSKQYDPILFYSFNQRRVSFDHLFEKKNLKRSLVLSTTNGKYQVQSYVNKWSINRYFFTNLLTNLARPKRLVYKDKAYGKNVDYLVDLTFKNGNEQVLALTKESYKYTSYENLNLTEDCFASKEKLKNHIESQKDEDLKISSVKVLDWKNRAEDYKELENDIYKAENYNKFYYRILGRIFTHYKDYLRKRKNPNN